MWRKWNPRVSLGVHNGVDAVENNLVVLQQVKQNYHAAQ